MVYSSGADVVEFIEYAFDAYKKIFVSDKNLVFSPLAFRVIHSALYQCAHGDTEMVMVQQLLKITTDQVIDKKEILQSQLINFNRLAAHPTYFNVIAKFFTNSFQSPSGRFERTLKKFDIHWKQVKFHKKRDELAKYLDDWISRKSYGQLNKMLEMEHIFDVTSLLAVCSLYFKIPWQTPFTKDSIKTKNFTNYDGDTVSMQFITDEDTYRISSNDNFDVLEMMYASDTQLMLWLLLPKQSETSIFELKDKINLYQLQQIQSGFEAYATRVQIPIFNVTSDVDGRHIIPELHSKSELKIYSKTKTVNWTEIRQRMMFGVNTNGTEASSSSVVKTRCLTGFHGMKSFKVNRPFIYMVLTIDKLEPIIIGHYIDAK